MNERNLNAQACLRHCRTAWWSPRNSTSSTSGLTLFEPSCFSRRLGAEAAENGRNLSRVPRHVCRHRQQVSETWLLQPSFYIRHSVPPCPEQAEINQMIIQRWRHSEITHNCHAATTYRGRDGSANRRYVRKPSRQGALGSALLNSAGTHAFPAGSLLYLSFARRSER